MAKTPKMTREEKAEAARQQRIAEKVAEFKVRVDRERAKRVYSDRVAFETPETDKSGAALWEMVREHARLRERLVKNIERMQARLADSLKRVGANENPSWYSTMLSDMPAAVERDAAQVESLSSAIARIAWVTGWYVPDVMPDRVNQQRDRLVSLAVVPRGDGFVVQSARGDDYAYLAHDGQLDPNTGVLHQTEQAAWLAAALFAGERIDTY